MLYVNGFQQLASDSVLDIFISSHSTGCLQCDGEINIHKSSQNFFWHSYWIYELENAFRSLGGDYECFSMPYWDVTHDEAYWSGTADPQIDDLPIYNRLMLGHSVRHQLSDMIHDD